MFVIGSLVLEEEGRRSRWVHVLWPPAAALLQPQQRVPDGMPILPAAAAAEPAVPFNSVFSRDAAAASNTAQPPNNINTFMVITPGPSVSPPFPGPSTKMLNANMEAFENKGKEVVNCLTSTQYGIHNLREKKRKDRINNSMKILQDLINCPGKMDKFFGSLASK